MDNAHVDTPEKLLRLPNYLTRQPLEHFRKLRLATQEYFQVRQIFLVLYPESSEASFAKYFAMKLTGQADLGTYYREKTAMGLQLGLPQEVILETLTEGLPFYDQRLVRVVPPENLGEWFRLAQRIHGPSMPTARHREDQPPTMSGPYPSAPRRTGAWTAPPPPSNCKFCGARHWHRNAGIGQPRQHTQTQGQCKWPKIDTRVREQCKRSQSNTPTSHAATPRRKRTSSGHFSGLRYNHIFTQNKFSVPCLRIPQVKIPTNSDKIITIRPYRVPICDQQEIRNQIQQMLENGIIEQSFSPFSSPVTLVTKHDKTKRFCIDYRKVNELISSDVHPLPRIEDILDRLAQAKYFSTADISSAYWQVPIHPDSRPLLAFATLEGLNQPTRLPFGLKPSPQIYERAMSQVLQRHGFDCVAHYFDDFIIFSNTLEKHQNHLRQFFAFCEVEKLQLNFAKCEFFKQSIDFLGYTITAGTTTPLTRNTDIIHAIKQPYNRKTLQSFLGAVNVYNKFIPEYARLRTPLNNLLKKDVVWVWDEACQKAFISLKGSLTQHPILHLYKEGLPCQVYCDASTLGIAGILKQVHPDGNVYPVQYFSRTLRSHERNYTISELECLAIVESVEKFRIYLMGRKFTIFSDHHALQWLKTIKNPSGRLFRWSLRLSSYEYEVRYIKGKQQYEADLLSRNPFCGFLDASLIKTHQPSPSGESSLTIDHNGLHTVSRKVSVLRTCKKTCTYVFPRDAAERDLACTETFDFSTPNEWPKWRKRFERYLVVSGMKKKEEADKIDLFMYLMGDRADDIFRTFKFEKEEEATKIDSVLKAFDSHFCVRKNIIYERAKFNSRIQEDREPVDEFITSLYKLADSCEFEGLHEQLIRDRIVVGVRDKALSERMQLDSELTLEKAVKMVRQQEAVRQQQVDLQRPSTSQKVNQVKFNSKKQSPKQQQQPSRKKEKSAKTRSRCPKCGGFTHREGQACRAEGQKCNLCSKTGHFANCCPDKQAKTAEVKAVSELDEEIGFLLEVSAVEDSSNLDDDEGECRRRWTAEIQVNGKKVKFKLDSQADVTCVPLCLFKKIMGQQRLVKSDINLRAAEFSELQTVGMFISTLRNGNYEIKEKIYVIRRLSEPLLSRRACELLNLARRIEVVATRINPIKEFPEVFEGLGQIGNPYEIKLKPGAKPYAVHTPRRVPIPLMEKLKTRLEELEKAGIIAQVNVATEWCAPTVIAGKPNGDKQLCVDLSRLNEHVQREVHPMPVVEHMLGQLGEARFFSKLDANSGFHQIPLSPDCQHLTTFITPFGRYKYCRMPFGISLAPEYFQRVMSIILQGMVGVMCYLDDILIFASDSKTHDRILRLVLRKLKEAKVTLNKAKCVFGVPRINFLGHILDEDGIRPDPAKIEAVVKMPAPTDVHGVRRFIGMVNHLGRFVENLSEIVAPLNQLLVKAYDVRKPTMVSSDASSYGLGAVLKQEGKNGIWRPVAYSSRTMTPTEKRYAQIEKEALAITWACERFQDFLLGKRFRIETDHKPLIPLFSTKELSSLTPRLQRFRMRMMRFGFEIVHIPGKELLDADALSRQPLLTTKGGENERQTSAHINAVLSSITDKDEMLTKIFEAQQEDTTLKAVFNYLEKGWPDKKKMSQVLLSYWHVKDELGVQNGLLMRSCRLVIPASMKLEILYKLHAGHFGITETRLRARETLDRLTASVVVRSCKSIFARHGIPETVVSDNGTQFGAAREFANFARQYGFTHVTSSPRFPQSNGMAEAGVKIAKMILKKNQDPSLGLLEYRSTPLENGYSPAELLMGRKLRTTLPIAPENLNPKLVDSQTLKRKEGRRRKDMKSRYDRRCGATDMEELSEGDTVWITDMRTWGIVKQKASTPRSYMVDTPVGTLRRNRFNLRKGYTVQYPADPSTPTFSGEELVENEKTPVVDYPSNDSEDGQIRTRRYWQIYVEVSDREKTAFITPDGLYEFKVIPFGLCNAPATIERMIDNLLEGLKWTICLCYLVDIIVFSDDFEEHLRRLQLALNCLKKAGLCLNSKKCKFGAKTITVLGHEKDWDRILPFVIFAYNTAKQDSTGFTPFFLVHGCEAETPLDVLFPRLSPKDDDFIQTLGARAKEARNLARIHSMRSQDSNKHRYDAHHRNIIYQPGDLVWIFIPLRKVGYSEKLMRRYFGPFKVTRNISDVTYEVETFGNQQGHRKTKNLVYICRMKPYLNPEDQEDHLEEDPEDDSTKFQEEDIPTERTQQPQTREEILGPITRSRALRLR
ncbi:K02A2.6-like, partial [Cordylochernes scorpioides]